MSDEYFDEFMAERKLRHDAEARIAQLESEIQRLEKIKFCVLHNGPNDGTGYGRVYGGGQRVYKLAHRAAWETAHGPIPDGLVIDHLCRNRMCVNVGHMELVTSVENVMRGNSGPAINARKTHCQHGHELTGDNVYIDKRGSRLCQTCRRAAERRYRAKEAS